MKKLISNIVFTKNRPLQLDAYLQSLYKHLTAEILQTYVLYKQELFDEIFGFSLRFSKEYIEAGGDPIEEINVSGQAVYRIDWRNGRTATSRYPFELCSTIYRTALIKNIIKSTMNSNPLIKKLFTPNSFLIRAIGKIISTRSILRSFGYFF